MTMADAIATANSPTSRGEPGRWSPASQGPSRQRRHERRAERADDERFLPPVEHRRMGDERAEAVERDQGHQQQDAPLRSVHDGEGHRHDDGDRQRESRAAGPGKDKEQQVGGDQDVPIAGGEDAGEPGRCWSRSLPLLDCHGGSREVQRSAVPAEGAGLGSGPPCSWRWAAPATVGSPPVRPRGRASTTRWCPVRRVGGNGRAAARRSLSASRATAAPVRRRILVSCHGDQCSM